MDSKTESPAPLPPLSQPPPAVETPVETLQPTHATQQTHLVPCLEDSQASTEISKPMLAPPLLLPSSACAVKPSTSLTDAEWWSDSIQKEGPPSPRAFTVADLTRAAEAPLDRSSTSVMPQLHRIYRQAFPSPHPDPPPLSRTGPVSAFPLAVSLDTSHLPYTFHVPAPVAIGRCSKVLPVPCIVLLDARSPLSSIISLILFLPQFTYHPPSVSRYSARRMPRMPNLAHLVFRFRCPRNLVLT